MVPTANDLRQRVRGLNAQIAMLEQSHDSLFTDPRAKREYDEMCRRRDEAKAALERRVSVE